MLRTSNHTENLVRDTIDTFNLPKSRSEYWLSSLKVATVLIFIILGVLVNVGLNEEHRFIGLSNWRIPGAPFVGGFGGFARVFVTASFACRLSRSVRFISLVTNPTRWWYREPWNHCRRDEKSFEKHAESSQVCFLAVCTRFLGLHLHMILNVSLPKYTTILCT